MQKISLPLAILALAVGIISLMWKGIGTANTLVYVDINQLVEGYARTAVERQAFDTKVNTLKANVDSLMTNWQAELQAYEKERAGMTAKELELKQELLQTKQQQLNNYQQAIQKQIQEEDQKMTQTVINDINAYVKEYGKREGHRIIFGARGSGSIMYAEEAANLTETVLAGLNAQYHGE